MTSNLQNPHRMFIQIMLGRRISSGEEVKRLHRACYEKHNTEPVDLKVFVDKINAAINLHNLAIKKGKDELSGEEYYVLINTADNELSRFNAMYKQKPKDLELLKRIIAGIVESDDGKVSSSTILNNAEGVKMSKKEADEIIKQFQNDGWLLEKEGYIFFSTRAIVELEHFLLTNYKELVTSCFICKRIVLQGISCVSCDVKIHIHCKQKFFAQVVDNNRCPECNEQFE